MAGQKAICVRIPLKDYERLSGMIAAGEYLNVSCLVRDLIKEKIREMEKKERKKHDTK